MPGGNRFSSWFEGRLAPWDLTGTEPPAYVDLRYFADVMLALDRLLPDEGLHVLATNDLVGPLPVTGDDVVVLCLEDELAVPPRYTHEVRLVAKTMGGMRRRPYVAVWPPDRWPGLPMAVGQEVLVQARRAPWRGQAAVRAVAGRRPAPVLDLPIGIRAYVPFTPKPIAERTYDVAFAGSMVNDATEHDRRWASQKLRARQAFLAEVERLRDDRPDLSVWLRVVATHWDGATATGSYTQAISDAKLVLCPRGSSVDTHRYFETLRVGAVPIYEMLPRRDYYDGAPGVRVRSWRELPAVVDRLLRDPDELCRQHEAALRWYDEWVAPEAVAERIARRLRRR